MTAAHARPPVEAARRRAHVALAWLGTALAPLWVLAGFLAMRLAASSLGLDTAADGTYAPGANAVLSLVAGAVTAAGLVVAVRLGLRAGHEGSAWGIGAAVTAGILMGFLLVGAVTSLLFG